MSASKLIAERKFFVASDLERSPVLQLQVMQPSQIQGEYPVCSIEITTANGALRREISGVDPVDCLLLAFAVAGTTIAGISESQYGGRLTWEGSNDEDKYGTLGLPTVETQFEAAYEAAVIWGPDTLGRMSVIVRRRRIRRPT